jgi:Outer membrane protein beta-barrel domain
MVFEAGARFDRGFQRWPHCREPRFEVTHLTRMLHIRMLRIGLLSGLLCLAAGGAFAQLPLGIGVKGGVALTDAFENNTFSIPTGVTLTTYEIHNYSPHKDYIVGPFIELRLPLGFAVEADALYRPLHFAETSSFGSSTAVPFNSASNSWEFPILAKYRFKLPGVRPYVDAGPTFRTTGRFTSYYVSNYGVAAGAGVDIKALFLHISPEIRYTHWAADAKSLAGATPLYSNVNQVELLVGISF